MREDQGSDSAMPNDKVPDLIQYEEAEDVPPPPFDPDLIQYEEAEDVPPPPFDPDLIQYEKADNSAADSAVSLHVDHPAPRASVGDVADAIDGCTADLQGVEATLRSTATTLADAATNMGELHDAQNSLFAATEALSKSETHIRQGRASLDSYVKAIMGRGTAEAVDSQAPQETIDGQWKTLFELDDMARSHLSVLLPQAARLIQMVGVLDNPSRKEKHRETVLEVIRVLRQSVAGVIDDSIAARHFQRPSSAEVSETEDWLRGLGRSIDLSLRAQALPWPPPGKEPPAIVGDLLDIYAATSSSTRRTPEGRPLGEILIEIEGKADNLIVRLTSGNSVEGLAGAATGRLSLFTRLTTNIALLITLLQAPGAALDFPKDAIELGKNVGRAAQIAYIAATDAAGEILDDLVENS